MTLKFKHRFIDDSFDRSQSKTYNLSIRFAPDGFSFCIYSPHENQVKVLCEYSFNTANVVQLSREIDQIMAEETTLRLPYDQVTAIYDDFRYLVVPLEFSPTEHVETLFQLSFENLLFETIIQNTINDQLSLAFGIPKPILRSVESHFSQARFLAPCYPIVKSIVENRLQENSIWLHLTDHLCHMVVSNEKGLYSATSFRIHADTDILFHCLNLIKQLDWDPLMVQINLSGKHHISQTLTRQLNQYLKTVNLLSLSSELKLPASFNTELMPDFIMIIKQAQCEL